MKKILVALLMFALIFSAVGCSSDKMKEDATKDPDVVIATVNGDNIYLNDFARNFKVVEYSYNSTYGEDVWTQEFNGTTVKDVVMSELLRNMIIEKIVVQQVQDEYTVDQALVDEKYKSFEESLDSNDTVKQFYADNGVDEAFIKEQLKNQFMVDYYKQTISDKVKADTAAIQERTNNYVLKVNASHILVATEDEANKVIERINAGEDFAALAKELSTDTGTKENGGELGYFERETMVAEFEAAAFGLDVGKVSEPVESQYGFHVIKVLDKKTLADMIADGTSEEEISQYREILVNGMVDEQFAAALQQLENDATIEKFEDKIKVN